MNNHFPDQKQQIRQEMVVRNTEIPRENQGEIPINNDQSYTHSQRDTREYISNINNNYPFDFSINNNLLNYEKNLQENDNILFQEKEKQEYPQFPQKTYNPQQNRMQQGINLSRSTNPLVDPDESVFFPQNERMHLNNPTFTTIGQQQYLPETVQEQERKVKKGENKYQKKIKEKQMQQNQFIHHIQDGQYGIQNTNESKLQEERIHKFFKKNLQPGKFIHQYLKKEYYQQEEELKKRKKNKENQNSNYSSHQIDEKLVKISQNPMKNLEIPPRKYQKQQKVLIETEQQQQSKTGSTRDEQESENNTTLESFPQKEEIQYCLQCGKIVNPDKMEAHMEQHNQQQVKNSIQKNQIKSQK